MKVYLDTIGCRLNQSEIETVASQFRSLGHEIVPCPESADITIINTCAVTGKAVSDSRKAIRRADRSGEAEIIVTGCWATLDPENISELSQNVKVVPNMRKKDLAADILGVDSSVFEEYRQERKRLPGKHFRTRAFIKAQDGCNNYCSFCIIRIARGPGRSRPVREVVNDIQLAANGGTREVVLTGVNLGSWGQDLMPQQHLINLIEACLTMTDISRLRLSSVEPWDLDEPFFALWKEPRLCRHLHLPLQSGSDVILRRMARKTTCRSYSKLLEMARNISPDIAITTDIITGFPGEKDTDFSESLEFVRHMGFAAGHVFIYSQRPGTPAFRYEGQVDFSVKRRRSAIMRQTFAELNERYRNSFLDAAIPVLWESADQTSPGCWRLKGLTDNYLRVESRSKLNLWNEISLVRLEVITPNGLFGRIIKED